MSLIPDLETQLRDAAARRHRRVRRRAIAALAAVAGAAVLLSSLLLVGGGDERRAGDRQAARERGPEGALPVGTVIPKGERGWPPGSGTVVASGTTPVAGAWQLEVWRDPSAGGPAATACSLDASTCSPGDQIDLSGSCGGHHKAPGFSRCQHKVPTLRKVRGRLFLPKEVLVFGRVPERARKVVITADRASGSRPSQTTDRSASVGTSS